MATLPTLVLVLDDEPMVREVVAEYLRRDGLRVHGLGDGSGALDWLRDHRPDLVVLDIMLSGTDGLRVLRPIRSAGDIPVILLTARTEELDRVLGLELGADDYVVKPFSPRELAARVRTVLRGASQPLVVDHALEFDRLRIGPRTREVHLDGQLVTLTPGEFELLYALAQSPRQVFSRRELLGRVWDSAPEYRDPAAVTVHVGRLRQKLEVDPEEPRWITTARGVGYRFRPVMEAVSTVLGVLALTAAAVGVGYVLRGVTRRTRSLRNLLLVVTFGSLVIGAIAAVVLARLMLLDAGGVRAAVGVLALTAVFATVLVLVTSAPLARDARRLEETVRGIESGDRSVRTGLQRADELGHVGRALDELTERLDALERERAQLDDARRAMFSNIGHDLRTPLAALRAAVEALADGVAPEPERYLPAMRRDVGALSALVDDLFLLARIESGRLDLRRGPLDLAELADEAVEALRPAAEARNVTIVPGAAGRAPVVGNATAIGRVIRNLPNNAIHHPPIRPPFERFARADRSHSRATGGVGLGLAIAHGLVEAHGGRVWIEHPPGGRVAFELPAAG